MERRSTSSRSERSARWRARNSGSPRSRRRGGWGRFETHHPSTAVCLRMGVGVAPVERQDWFHGIYTSTYRAVIGCAYFIVLDRDIAAEITHDAFLRLWEHHGRLASGSNEKAWLIRVVTNLGISYRRSQGAAWRRP